MTAISKFAHLSAAEKILVLRASAVLVTIKVGLMTLGFPTVRRFTSRAKTSSNAWSSTSVVQRRTSLKRCPSVETIARAIEAAGARVAGGRNCLVRALAAEYLLNRYAYQCELRIGAKRGASGEFTAHAWLECEGRVIIGEFELETYARLVPRGSGAAGSHL